MTLFYTSLRPAFQRQARQIAHHHSEHHPRARSKTWPS
jgi:hypothetical protein